MKTSNFVLMVLALAAMTVSARPQFRSTLGVTSGHNGHFEFDNTMVNGHKRDLTPEEPQLSYTADVKKNFHSLDLEESIDSIECSADSLTLHLVSKDAVRRWGRHFYVSGGAEWGCSEGVILRKVERVEWLGSDASDHAVVRFATKPAQYTDVFERAHISFKQLVPEFRSELQVAPKPEAPKMAVRDEANIPTLGSAKMAYYDEFPMDPEEETILDSSSEEDPLNGAKLTIHSPVDSDGFFNGDFVNFSWSYTGKVADTDYWVVALCTDKNKNVIYQSARIAPTERQHIAMLNTTASGNKYKAFVFLYNKKNKVSKNANRGPYYVNYKPDFMLATPEATDVFKSGDLMTVSWEYAEGFGNQKVELQLCTYDDGIVKCSKKASIAASRLNYTQKCDNKMKTDGQYFWRLKYNKGCVNGRLFTFYYTHNIKEKIYIENPTVGDEYHSGDVIKVRWSYQDFAVGEKVRLQLCKQRWGFNKCYQDYGYVEVTLGGANLLIPDGLHDSTLYYVSLRYHRSSHRWHRAESKRFAINHNPRVRFTSPKWYDIYEPGSIAATWTTDLPQTEEVYVTLRKKLPLVFDPFYLFHATHSTAVKVPVGIGMYAFDVPEGFYTPSYFTIRYNCLFGKHFCHEEASPLFTVKDVRHAGWNYNQATGSALVDPYPLYSYSCADCEKGANTSNIFCDICNKWHEELNFESKCENCYAAADFVMYDLELDLELGAVIACTFNVNGSVAFNLGNFHNKITSEYEKRLALHLLTVPITGIPFKVAGVNVGTSFTVDVDMDTLFKYDSAVALDAGFSRKADIWGRLEYGTTTRNGIFVGARNYEGPTPTGLAVSGTATASVGVGFKVSINADLSLICSLQIWAEPVFTPSLSFSYPAFQGKPTGGDKCAEGHYAEYAVDFDFYHGGEGKVVFPKKHYSNSSHDFHARFVDGCFLPAKSPVASLTLHLNAEIGTIFPGASSASALSALVHEAAEAINVSADTIYMPDETDTRSMRFTFMSEDAATSTQSKAALKAALDSLAHPIWRKPAFKTLKPFYLSSNE